MRVNSDWLDHDGRLLSGRCPLPLTEPFTVPMAEAWGLSRNRLSLLHAQGLVRRVLKGVYAASQASDHVEFRARALALVLPESAIVTDRTAAWLHGVELFTRTDREAMPVQCFESRPGFRLRHGRVLSGERRLGQDDVVEVYGVQATTPLRTACDLARLLWRFDALGAIDGFLRLGLDQQQLNAELCRFRGYRGIRQARVLVPLGDGRAESMGESGMRLHWIEAGLPKPELQIWVPGDRGEDRYRIDLGDPGIGYGVEYDGVEFHSSDEAQARDGRRRAYLREQRHWEIDVLERRHVYGLAPSAPDMLAAGYARARRSVTTRRWVCRCDGWAVQRVCRCDGSA